MLYKWYTWDTKSGFSLKLLSSIHFAFVITHISEWKHDIQLENVELSLILWNGLDRNKW